jgi:esterase/lipase superfamily enzyme
MCSPLKHILLFALLIALSGCQPKVYLMPAPVGIAQNSQFFLLSEENIDENLLYTLYATNRIPFEKINDSTGYTIFPSDTLELGFLIHSVGEDDMSWNELYGESLSRERKKDLLLTQQFVKPMAMYHKDDDLTKSSDKANGFFTEINEALARSFNKDITVYVHGANSNFYRATAQGAQLFHFTGHNSIILTFSWPSAENLFKYKVDVLHAKKTIPAFAHLLEILALHTKAEHINIIAYSAGAQVVAPGLAYVYDQYPELSSMELKKRLRIGEVYFAAPDTSFRAFTERYLKFRNIVDRTTIVVNVNDRILLLAAIQNGVSRLGRPDIKELDDSEKQLFIKAMNAPDLDVIDAGGSKALNIGRGHDFWYSNTWVSTDLLMLLFFNASPEERGLVGGTSKNGADLFLFPDNYSDIIPSLMQKQKKKVLRLRSEVGEQE